MKNVFIPAFVFHLIWSNVYSQSAITISTGPGINKVITSSPKNTAGFTGFLAIGLEPKSQTKRLKLMPALEFKTSNYFAPIEENVSLNINQTTAGMRFLIGFPISESWNLKAGLFANYIFMDNVLIEYNTQMGAISSFSNDDLLKLYFPNKFQAGLSFAINRSIDKAKKYSVEFIIQQNANSILEKELSFALFNQNSKLLFRQKSLPTFFCLAVNAKISKSE